MPRRPKEINLSDITQEALRAQRDIIRELCARSDEARDSERIDSAMRALACLIKEARSLQKDAVGWAAALTAEEKRAAIVDWYHSLPEQQQHLLLQELLRIYNERRSGTQG